MVPVRAKFLNLLVELDADAAAHADDHGLAVHGFKALFEMIDDVLGDEGNALGRADHGFHTRPFAFQFFLSGNVFFFGDFLEVGIDFGAFFFLKFNFGEAAFIEDANGGAVLDGALDVVHVDVVAKDGGSAAIADFERRGGKADERGIRQGIAHMAGEAINEIVLAAVGFVGDDNDIAAVGEDGVLAPFAFREKFLNRGKNHAS